MKHLRKIFSNPPSIWNDPTKGLFLFLLLSFTVFRALIVVPHYYILTHYFFSYKFGLIKRGLVGTLLQPLINGKNNEQIIFIISIFSFLIFTFLIVGLFIKWIIYTKEDPLLSLAGFAFFRHHLFLFYQMILPILIQSSI